MTTTTFAWWFLFSLCGAGQIQRLTVCATVRRWTRPRRATAIRDALLSAERRLGSPSVSAVAPRVPRRTALISIASHVDCAPRTCRVASDARPFVTEGGEQLCDVTLTYETWGRLNRARDNVVLVLHALTGDAHAASHPTTPGDRTGWWEELIGPGRAIDTRSVLRDLRQCAGLVLWLNWTGFTCAGWRALEPALSGVDHP